MLQSKEALTNSIYCPKKFEVKTEPEKYPSFENETKGYIFPPKTENQDITSNIQPSFYQSTPQPPAYYSRG